MSDREELAILSYKSKSKTPVAGIGQALVAPGKLSGFVLSKKQPYPGLKVMARALEELATIKDGLLIASKITLQD